MQACRAFLHKTDEIVYLDPQAGLRHAVEGLRRIESLGNPPDLRALALKYLGSAQRAIGRNSIAVETLTQALRIHRDHLHDPLEEADVLRRLALALTLAPPPVGGTDLARDAAHHALVRYELANHPEGVARVRVASAHIHLSVNNFCGAFGDFCSALPYLTGGYLEEVQLNLPTMLIRARRAGQRFPRESFYQAKASIRLSRISKLSRLRWKDMPAHLTSFGRSKRTLPDAKLRWTLGLLLDLERDTAGGIKQLESARRDLALLDLPADLVTLSLDLGELYAKVGSWRKLARVAAESLEIVEENDPDALAAFEQWQLAAHAQDPCRMRMAADECRDSVS